MTWRTPAVWTCNSCGASCGEAFSACSTAPTSSAGSSRKPPIVGLLRTDQYVGLAGRGADVNCREFSAEQDTELSLYCREFTACMRERTDPGGEQPRRGRGTTGGDAD